VDDVATNVEIARRAIDAVNDGDLTTALRDADPKTEVDWSRSRGPHAGIYHGYGASLRFWTAFLETFERVEIKVDEFIERGDHVVMPNRVRVWGRDGVEATAHSVQVATIRRGRIVRWTLYQEKSEAFDAVGLRE
jgi:ketosteroid isomerase-like protein